MMDMKRARANPSLADINLLVWFLIALAVVEGFGILYLILRLNAALGTLHA